MNLSSWRLTVTPVTKKIIRSFVFPLCAVLALLVAMQFGGFIFSATSLIVSDLLLRLLATGIAIYFSVNWIVDFVRKAWFS
jgi:hypothetical protein